MKRITIIGAGGFGREVAWLIERINKSSTDVDTTTIWDFRGFIDDNQEIWNTKIDGYPVLGGLNLIEESQQEIWCVLAIGNSNVRQILANRLQRNSNVHFATLIDPSVMMSESVSIGEGCIICAGNILTVDISIGDHCIINLGCTVGHDAILGDYVTLYPGVNVSGAVNIGNTTEIGTGTAIIQGVSIGDFSIIGANSTVIRNIEPGVTAVGSPARIVNKTACAADRGGADRRKPSETSYIPLRRCA